MHVINFVIFNDLSNHIWLFILPVPQGLLASDVERDLKALLMSGNKGGNSGSDINHTPSAPTQQIPHMSKLSLLNVPPSFLHPYHTIMVVIMVRLLGRLRLLVRSGLGRD